MLSFLFLFLFRLDTTRFLLTLYATTPVGTTFGPGANRPSGWPKGGYGGLEGLREGVIKCRMCGGGMERVGRREERD